MPTLFEAAGMPGGWDDGLVSNLKQLFCCMLLFSSSPGPGRSLHVERTTLRPAQQEGGDALQHQ